MTKSIELAICTEDLQVLKQGRYRLCFAKKVNGSYNVVWQSSERYMPNNLVSWIPQYAVFASNRFEEFAPVDIASNTVDICMGETATLGSDGVISKAVAGGKANALTIGNEYGFIHIGVGQFIYGIDGQPSMQPIYLTEYTSVKGTVELTPVDKILVWFEQDCASGMVFRSAKSTRCEIDLTNCDKRAVEYKNGTWSIR